MNLSRKKVNQILVAGIGVENSEEEIFNPASPPFVIVWTMSGPIALASVFPRTGWSGFFHRYWPHKPLHAKGPLSRLRDLDDLSSLGGIAALAVRSQMELKAMLPSKSADHNELKITAGDIFSAFDSGATIACNSLHRWHPAVRQWTELLSLALTGNKGIGVCNAYITPEGLGVPMHFDDHEILVMQLAGRKKWTFAPNLQVRYPTSNSGRMLTEEVRRYASGPMLQEMPKPNRSVTMTPGTVLFLPRGYWHETDASELSISLTFGFRTPCWAELLTEKLHQELLTDPKWREPAWSVYGAKPGLGTDAEWNAKISDLQGLLRNLKPTDLA
jgi:50S ribosomal protein L16 3-hydroxylase